MAEKKSAKKSTETNKNVETEKAEKVEKKKRGWIWGLAVGCVAIIVAVIVAIVLNLKPGDPSDVTAKLSYTNSFFISDDGYTLWNAEGKRLTEDKYDAASDFVGGYAYVKKGDQVGIIKDDGKMSVEFGKYGNITVKGGLYLAQDGNTKEYQLITGFGKVLAKGADLKVFAATGLAGAAAVESDNKIKLYNYSGNLITETSIADDADNPELNTSADFGIIYYANQNFVFDARDGRLIATFDGERYSFEEVSEDRSKILLEDYADTSKYKLLADGRVYDLDEMKYYAFTTLNTLIGYNNTSELALLDSDYKVLKKVDSYIEIKDSYNYAVENGDKVEIYRNGEKIKEFENAEVPTSGMLYEDYYAIESDDKAMFYNLDGSIGINHEFKEIARMFDLHHLAMVSDADNEYYLIDKSGNKVADYTARSFAVTKGGYEVRNADNKYAIANKSGKLVSEFVYDDTYYRSYAEPHNIWTGEKDTNSYDVVDAESGKVVVSDVNTYDFTANYFVVKNSEGKKVYYTYTGEIFYTES
ncbi:WG repeat-containing protein [Candidatus Saccharibacteria bacterium]|nr:WG repeat-containing protein [Candidatus Saccharibacteria bacterium]